MDELVLRKHHCLKHFFLILSLSCHLCLHVTQSAFPMERDVAELTGVSSVKRWVVFIEKLTMVCLNGIKNKDFSGLTDILWCMTKRNVTESTLWHYSRWAIIRRYPNILHSESYLPLQIIVHHQFNLNVTVINYFQNYARRKTGEIYLMISGKRYGRLLYPFTFMSTGNSLDIEFPVNMDICIDIEYSISQRFNLTHYRETEGNGMFFLWSYFPVRFCRIHVDMRARLSFSTTSCLRCKMIVYDGPTENHPIIMVNNGTSRYQSVMASTFQVFVVLIEVIHQQEIVITYVPTYITTAVYNISNNNNVEMIFDNRTRCHGYSLYARLCVFVFYTSSSKTIRFSMKDLRFNAKYSGNQYATGIVLFNHFNGTTEKLVELNSDLGEYETSEFEIIGTGSKMHVSIFEYILFASITVRFSMSTANCNSFLVGDNHISYSGYITPVYGKYNVFQINQSSQALVGHNICYKFQFIHIKPSRYSFRFIFPDVIPMLVMKGYITLHQKRKNAKCSIDIERQHHQTYWLGTHRFPVEKWVVLFDSFTVESCSPLQYNSVQITTLPCKIPCPVIAQEKYCSMWLKEPNVWWEDNDNITCDICKNFYVFCKDIDLPSNILPLIRIKSKVCKYASVQMWTEEPSLLIMTLTFDRNDLFSVISAFKLETDLYISSTLCVVGIPKHALKLVTPNIHQEITQRVVKTHEWGGAMYHSVHQHIKASWEEAASYCQESGAFLLTIHSRGEYLFVKKTFLKTYNIVVLYVGLQKKVRYL